MIKTVYISFSDDLIYQNHINIIKKSAKLGNVIIGLLTDSAISKYKTIPHLSFEQRKKTFSKLSKYIKEIVPQYDLDYTSNLKKIKPNYVAHGDDWKNGYQKDIRKKVINTLKAWSGKLIEYPYDYEKEEINRSLLKKITNSPDNRRAKFRRLLKCKKIVRFIEAHSPLTGIIAEKMEYFKKDTLYEFDGLWSSSLTDSAIRGKPDNQSVDYSTRINGLNEILDVTKKPFMFDGDNGGKVEHLPYMIRTLDRLGVSAIVLEDKRGLKVNSLSKTQNKNSQDTIKNFKKKIEISCENRSSKDFLIIARIESLVLGKGYNDAIKRAIAYSKSGADLIFISSKEKTPNQIITFSKKFKKSKYFIPMIATPSTYSKTNEELLIKNNFKVVLYANQLLRAAYPAISQAAKDILINRRSFEAEKKMLSIKEILNLIND
ncbi:phosphoenolpyruvate mutase [Candidatus Pelagibacter ubique]|jgi:phosphoenolpyruvate phosphomutase / 2-hydroxyethylphosphonate cytidylyltransferase|nr:phosphoenolpyruvate mutase [Candidatus Pelagibacter ubique]